MNNRHSKNVSNAGRKCSNKERWIQIAANEIDCISRDLLHWSGLQGLWDANNLNEQHDFYQDVVRACPHVFFTHDDWDKNFPGQGGTIVTIESNDPDALKAEMRALINGLISEK